MSRAKKRKTKAAGTSELPILRPNAAGVHIGATEIFVAVPPDRDPEPVRAFPTFTEDLHKLVDWLKACRIETVAMESTGVYWIPLFQILEARGFEVCLVNARYFQNVPGRRTDVSDCQWLRNLQAVGHFGLLFDFREAFRTYRVEAACKRLAAGKAYAQGRTAHRFSEADVERLVDETRTELRAGRRKRR